MISLSDSLAFGAGNADIAVHALVLAIFHVSCALTLLLLSSPAELFGQSFLRQLQEFLSNVSRALRNRVKKNNRFFDGSFRCDAGNCK